LGKSKTCLIVKVKGTKKMMDQILIIHVDVVNGEE